MEPLKPDPRYVHADYDVQANYEAKLRKKYVFNSIAIECVGKTPIACYSCGSQFWRRQFKVKCFDGASSANGYVEYMRKQEKTIAACSGCLRTLYKLDRMQKLSDVFVSSDAAWGLNFPLCIFDYLADAQFVLDQHEDAFKTLPQPIREELQELILPLRFHRLAVKCLANSHTGSYRSVSPLNYITIHAHAFYQKKRQIATFEVRLEQGIFLRNGVTELCRYGDTLAVVLIVDKLNVHRVVLDRYNEARNGRLAYYHGYDFTNKCDVKIVLLNN